MGDTEKWQYHAYDYGWRRVLLGDYERRSPIDPRGKWFDEAAVDKAEQFYAARWRRPARQQRISAADQAEARGDHEEAAFLRAEDRARAALAAKIEGDGNNKDGTRSPAALEYVALCCAQARAALSGFAARNRAAFAEPGAPAAHPLAEMQRALGLRAVEQFYEQDDEEDPE